MFGRNTKKREKAIAFFNEETGRAITQLRSEFNSAATIDDAVLRYIAYNDLSSKTMDEKTRITDKTGELFGTNALLKQINYIGDTTATAMAGFILTLCGIGDGANPTAVDGICDYIACSAAGVSVTHLTVSIGAESIAERQYNKHVENGTLSFSPFHELKQEICDAQKYIIDHQTDNVIASANIQTLLELEPWLKDRFFVHALKSLNQKNPPQEGLDTFRKIEGFKL